MNIEEKINLFLNEENEDLNFNQVKNLNEGSIPREIKGDPLYMKCINSKTKEEFEEAVKTLINIRGRDAMKTLKKALKQMQDK